MRTFLHPRTLDPADRLPSTWSSQNDAVRRTDEVGTTTISASYLGITGSTTLTVKEACLQSIEVSPGGQVVGPGFGTLFNARGTYVGANGQTFVDDLTDRVAWSSSDRSIVAMSNVDLLHGRATALASGKVTISHRRAMTSIA